VKKKYLENQMFACLGLSNRMLLVFEKLGNYFQGNSCEQHLELKDDKILIIKQFWKL